jgi:hypothetical protein
MARERTADPEAETRLDDAKERLQQGTDSTPAKRPKSPSAYHVFQLVEGVWQHLTESAAVKATTRKEAIKKATERLEEKAGTFVAVRETEFQPVVRRVKQEVIDIFE